MILYHISPFFLGEKVLFKPRKMDDMISRICVAPTPEQCMLAIPETFLDGRKNLYIYYTHAKEFQSGTEFDTAVTQEKWLIKPHWFSLQTKTSTELSLFVKNWVYNDKWGVECNFLSRKDRISLLRIKLRGIRNFLKKNDINFH